MYLFINGYLRCREMTIAEKLLGGDKEEEEADFTLPLSQVINKTISDLEYQPNIFSAFCPKIDHYRRSDYKVRGGFSDMPAKLDEDISLLGKPSDTMSLKSKTIEECEKLVRQAVLVNSHCDWVLGAMVALMQNQDTAGVLKSIDSITTAFKHNSG
jgi:hypothetical protein